jgi:hypothetical protein
MFVAFAPIATALLDPFQAAIIAFQTAEVAIPRILFADILRLVSELRPPPAVAST